jgi:myo-inositol-1(or 4)-monophosphatase
MSEELPVAEIAAKKAGEVVRSLFGNVEVAEKGENFNLVTEADTSAERAIIEIVRKKFPDDAILGEESAAGTALDAPRLWIIDPLDGTTNFAHRIPHFSISIAFAVSGEVQCGVVFHPVGNECFCAQRGTGAWCNGIPIRVSSTGTLSKAVIGTGFYYERGPLMLRTLDALRKLYTARIRGMRRIGSAALDLCYVACGRFDGYFEYQLSPWDFAAGMLILKEAGGRFTDSDGVDRGLFSKGVISSNSILHKEFCIMILSAK